MRAANAPETSLNYTRLIRLLRECIQNIISFRRTNALNYVYNKGSLRLYVKWMPETQVLFLNLSFIGYVAYIISMFIRPYSCTLHLTGGGETCFANLEVTSLLYLARVSQPL